MKAKKFICAFLMLVMILTMFTTYVKAEEGNPENSENPGSSVNPDQEQTQTGTPTEEIQYAQPIVNVTLDPKYPDATFVTVTFPEGANIPDEILVRGNFPTIFVGSSAGGLTNVHTYIKGSSTTDKCIGWVSCDTNKNGSFSIEKSVLDRTNMFVIFWGEGDNLPLAKEEKVEDNTVVASSDGTVSTSYFTEVKGTTASLTVVSASRNVTWKFEGQNITNENIILNANADIQNEKFDYMKNNFISEKEGVFVDFEHQGNLPGKAKVTLKVGTEKFGTGNRTLYLYLYNPAEDTYIYQSEASYSNGEAAIGLTHCSSYVLIDHRIDVAGVGGSAGGVAPAAAQYVGGVLDKEPKTGEVSFAGLYILSTISLAVFAITKQHK